VGASQLSVVSACLAAGAIVSGQIRTAPIPDRPPADRQPVVLAKPRVGPLPEAQWSAAQKELAARYSQGPASNQLKTLLHVPDIVEGAMPFTVYLSDQSTLTPRHRAILILRTAWLFGSQPLWATHVNRARSQALVSAAEFERIARGPDTPGVDAFERLLMQMADQLYRNSSINDATWKGLSSQYDANQLMDAVETVNHFGFLAMLFNSLGVQPDAGLTDRLPKVAYRVNVPEPEPPLTKARVDPNPGQGIAVSRTFARHAKLNQARGPRANFINRVSPLTPRHREMFILRIGWDCRSEYEWAQHVGSVGRARDHGADPLAIARGPDAPGIDPFDAAILRATDELYRNAIVSDATWNALSKQYDTAKLMSAVYTAASYRATSMSLNAYGVQLEPTDERFPQIPSR
jgi:alkylhydroperoxidase family enzyme